MPLSGEFFMILKTALPLKSLKGTYMCHASSKGVLTIPISVVVPEKLPRKSYNKEEGEKKKKNMNLRLFGIAVE